MEVGNKRISIYLVLLCWLPLSTLAFSSLNNLPEKSDNLISPDKLKEDLDFLFKTIEEVHPNMYAYTSKEEFAQHRNQVYKQINHPMNNYEFYKSAAVVIASLKNGHTFIVPPTAKFQEYVSGGGKVFPLVLYWDASNIILAGNHSSTELPLGKTVLTINEKPASEIFKRFACRIAAEGKSENLSIVERSDMLRLLLWLEYGSIDSWVLNIETGDGAVSNYLVKSITQNELRSNKLVPIFERKNSYRNIPECEAGLIELNSFGNSQEFKVFLDETFKKIHKQSISDLIIDIRKNPGGSDTNANMLLEYLTEKPYSQIEEVQIKISSQTQQRIAHLRREAPEAFADKKEGDTVTLELPLQTPTDNPLRFTGRTFVLIGPGSFSTSTSFASAIKAFRIGILVGQETGDPTRLYGDSLTFSLPNSGLVAAVACKTFAFAGSKPDGQGITPDYKIKQKSEDNAKGIDTVLQFALDLISNMKSNPRNSRLSSQKGD